MLDTGNNAPQPVDAMDALQRFRDEIIETNKARQLFTVSRMEGIEELKLDVLVHYKSRTSNLKAHPRVRFNQEEGAGSGPVRDFLSIATKIADEVVYTVMNLSMLNSDRINLPPQKKKFSCTD